MQLLRRAAQTAHEGGLLQVKLLLAGESTRWARPLSVADVWRDYLMRIEPLIGNDDALAVGQTKIAVILLSSDCSSRGLRRTLASIKRQLHPGSELLICAAKMLGSRQRRMIDRCLGPDYERQYFEFSPAHTLAEDLALALNKLTGEYVAFVDEGDELTFHALARLDECIRDHTPDLIYSDAVIFSGSGESAQFLFRPTFSPQYLRGYPYIHHLTTFERRFLQRLVESGRTITTFQQMILSGTEDAERIAHIPDLLYRQNRKLSRDLESLQGTRECDDPERVTPGDSRRANRLTGPDPLRYRDLDLDVAGRGTRVAILVPSKDHGNLVRQCVESLQRTLGSVSHQIVVIDHASTEPETLAYFGQLSQSHTVLRYEGSFNFSAINNWAVARLPRDITHYLFCNNDIEALAPGWLEAMLVLADQHDVGIVGACLLYPDRKHIQHAGDCVGLFGTASHLGNGMLAYEADGTTRNPGYGQLLCISHEVSAVTAACMLMRREAFEKVGGYDESFAVGFGDVDLCLRTLRSGFRVLYCADAILTHHESFSRGAGQTAPHTADTTLFLNRWADLLRDGDPYFNPGFSDVSTSWAVKSPLPVARHVKSRLWIREQFSGLNTKVLA